MLEMQFFQVSVTVSECSIEKSDKPVHGCDVTTGNPALSANSCILAARALAASSS